MLIGLVIITNKYFGRGETKFGDGLESGRNEMFFLTFINIIMNLVGVVGVSFPINVIDRREVLSSNVSGAARTHSVLD